MRMSDSCVILSKNIIDWRSMETAITKKIVADVLSDFDDIKSNHKISDEQFEKGFKFAMLVSEGKDKQYAYMVAFDEENKGIASTRANQLVRTKWCSAIIDRLICGNHILFADKHYQALNELFQIGMTASSEKVRSDSLKAFCDLTKRPETKVGVAINLNLGSEMIDKLEAQLNAMASQSMIVNKQGEIIDCEVVK